MCVAYVYVLAYVCEWSAAEESVVESNSRWKKKPSESLLATPDTEGGAQACATLQLYVWLICRSKCTLEIMKSVRVF